MGLNIKKPNYLNTSLIEIEDYNKTYEYLLDKEKDQKNVKHPFLIFKNLLEKSWIVKIDDLKQGDELENYFIDKKIDGVSLTPDALKNRSLITYMDAPWGSGKTYFIENLIKWIKKDGEKKEEFILNRNTKLDIAVLDAWEIYDGGNIEDFLINSFKIEWNDFLNFLKTFNEKHENRIKNFLNKLSRTIFLPIKKILTSSSIGVSFGVVNGRLDLSKFFKKNREFKKIWYGIEKEQEDVFKKISEEKKLKLFLSLYIEDKYKNNNNLIVIDNIERLSSENRLDVINKIMNWANLSGTTYLFLTNFQKINVSTVFEEDFWNKISLHETFKLTNSWESYISNYKRDNFDLSEGNYKDIKDFILNMIPTFFSKNNDNMDIREIKKLLDNWEEKNENENNKTLIISLLNEIINKNLEGLDKYFFINYSISWLSENKWFLWEKENPLIKELNKEPISNMPLINNKMFRIQSNFYDLKIIKEGEGENEFIKFKKEDWENFTIIDEELVFFKKFNNFIDDKASHKFQNIINDILKTRKIIDKNNYIFKYMNLMNKNEIRYFEFKYNNIKKIHIYNDIFNSKNR